jgi:DNA-binding LacI/PurR family transcriptional regulator/signal transduction histidine kinase/ActR/RegA family two-component response regulator
MPARTTAHSSKRPISTYPVSGRQQYGCYRREVERGATTCRWGNVTYTGARSRADGNATSNSRGWRRTIAVLLDYMNFFGGAFENHIRASLNQKSRELDVNLIFYFGRDLYEPHFACPAHNAIFDLIHPDRVDGVIVLSGMLTSSCGAERLPAFLERYQPLPICSVGVAVPGVPSLLVDNELGIQNVVRHLVTVHGHRRIVFVSGPAQSPESQTRLRAYHDVLAAIGLPVAPELIVEGRFTQRGGYLAVEALLNAKIPFDAVLAANDDMAFGAIRALREHGLRVPRDISVTGFDDLRLARLSSPPLTSVSQPFDELAEKALKLVLAQCDGEVVPAVTSCPTQLRVRRSCGCSLAADTPACALQEPPETLRPASYLRQHRVEILAQLSKVAASGWGGRVHDCEALVEALCEELGGAPGSLLSALEGMLEAPSDNQRYRSLHMAITQLRASLRPVSGVQLERLWFDALDLVTLSNTTAQMQHRLDWDEHYMQLLSFGEYSSVAFDRASLRAALANGIPSVGVKTAYISRWTDTSWSALEPLVCLCDGEALEAPVSQFPGHQLFPPSFAVGSPEQRQALLVFPLCVDAQKLGVAVFEYTTDRNVYSTLRDQICTTLRIVALHQDLVHQTMLHERSVQERLATTHRIHSLSLLAGGVAHDLNNTLGPVVALPDLILHQLQGLEGCPSMVRDDLQSIQSASLRASQTIKDLLTLGRQGRMPRRAIDLCRVLGSCLGPEFSRPLETRQPQRSRVRLVLPEKPVLVHGSETHLARAVTNLVLNALEATSHMGEVVVRIAERHLETPLTGYEAVDPGHYAVITVSDMGHGMAAEDLVRVFEPFFSKKRVGERSGSGLGLAIVHGVVKEHHGYVDVQSRLGVGTTFTLYLPLTHEPAQSEQPRPDAPRGTARILMVDDDLIQLRTGQRILTHLGYQVTTLESGREALALLQRRAGEEARAFDLLILDVLLNEERDGLEILECARELFPGQKAILVSGHAPSERAERARDQGVQWLPKPFTLEALGRAVSIVLSTSRAPTTARHAS